jgi:predicted nucleic acid-binding protein
MRRVIADTGPLVALLNGRDAHHLWARDAFDRIAPPVLTCEAVVSEACFVLRRAKGGPDAVLELVSRGVIELSFRLGSEIAAVRKLMTRYASVPMSLADACLVRMTELDAEAVVVTLDADFGIYRRNGRQAVPVISPKRG